MCQNEPSGTILREVSSCTSTVGISVTSNSSTIGSSATCRGCWFPCFSSSSKQQVLVPFIGEKQPVLLQKLQGCWMAQEPCLLFSTSTYSCKFWYEREVCGNEKFCDYEGCSLVAGLFCPLRLLLPRLDSCTSLLSSISGLHYLRSYLRWLRRASWALSCATFFIISEHLPLIWGRGE